MAEITKKFRPMLSLGKLYEKPKDKDIPGDSLPLVSGLETKELLNIVRILYSLFCRERYRAGLETPSGIDAVIVNDFGSKSYLFTLGVRCPDDSICSGTWYYDKEKYGRFNQNL
jgi:hypothetical protein